MPARNDERQNSAAGYFAALLIVSFGMAAATQSHALGTAAGREILNTAEASFDLGGVPQTPVSSNSVQTFVDELLDATLVNDDGGPVAVSSPQTGAIVSYTLTNTGNGNERFRLIADDTVGGDVFDPILVQIHLETNAVPGLQIGAGGDTAYLAGSNDPLLAADATQVIYVENNIPGAQAFNDDGIIELRAVANTIFVNAGTDDPTAPAFPGVGVSYPGQGDLDVNGGANVTAVVGTSHDAANRLFLTQASYRVSSAVVALTKSAVTVLDPFGGATLVPGSVITYQIDVTVSGSGDAENLVITDPIPADLEYQPGSLNVSALPAGEEQDDDFAPAGTDTTGFDGANQTITVNLDAVSGGGPVITITFQTTIR
ncbi:MAG: isopeptide-forming domain-containing fimbrial protein [Gammaproteobacteria bacterium]|nr:isopeptide-forming domain-containing fimbrial protein [Gammaproteobacteria bacterium]